MQAPTPGLRSWSCDLIDHADVDVLKSGSRDAESDDLTVDSGCELPHQVGWSRRVFGVRVTVLDPADGAQCAGSATDEFRRIDLQHPTRGNHPDPVGQVLGLVEVMRGQQD